MEGKSVILLSTRVSHVWLARRVSTLLLERREEKIRDKETVRPLAYVRPSYVHSTKLRLWVKIWNCWSTRIYCGELQAFVLSVKAWESNLFLVMRKGVLGRWFSHSTVRFQSTGEIKSREVELSSHSWMDCFAAELFLNSCFSDSYRSTQVASHWRGPHLLNIVALVVAGRLFFTCGSAEASYYRYPMPRFPGPW